MAYTARLTRGGHTNISISGTRCPTGRIVLPIVHMQRRLRADASVAHGPPAIPDRVGDETQACSGFRTVDAASRRTPSPSITGSLRYPSSPTGTRTREALAGDTSNTHARRAEPGQIHNRARRICRPSSPSCSPSGWGVAEHAQLQRAASSSQPRTARADGRLPDRVARHLSRRTNDIRSSASRSVLADARQ